MPFRAIACCGALILALLLCLDASAEPCEGAACRAAKPSTPLDIMRFMREQAASTRVGEAKAKKPTQRQHRAVAMQPRPLPTEAVGSFAAQPAPEVEVVESDELNAIDRAGEAAVPETVGTAPAVERIVGVAEVGPVTTVKAEDWPQPSDASRDAPPAGTESRSWLGAIWSAFKATFAALAAAVHQLIG